MAMISSPLSIRRLHSKFLGRSVRFILVHYIQSSWANLAVIPSRTNELETQTPNLIVTLLTLT